MTPVGVLSDFRRFSTQKKIKRAILLDFSTISHFFQPSKDKKIKKKSSKHVRLIFFGAKTPRKRCRIYNLFDRNQFLNFIFWPRMAFFSSFVHRVGICQPVDDERGTGPRLLMNWGLVPGCWWTGDLNSGLKLFDAPTTLGSTFWAALGSTLKKPARNVRSDAEVLPSFFLNTAYFGPFSSIFRLFFAGFGCFWPDNDDSDSFNIGLFSALLSAFGQYFKAWVRLC